MSILHTIAERKIAEAIANGDLRTEGWHNRPLPQDSDPLLPDDLRMAYKILKNSGFVPPEIQARKEIERLEELVDQEGETEEMLRRMKKLRLLIRQIGMARPTGLDLEGEYYRKVVARVRVATRKKEG